MRPLCHGRPLDSYSIIVQGIVIMNSNIDWNVVYYDTLAIFQALIYIYIFQIYTGYIDNLDIVLFSYSYSTMIKSLLYINRICPSGSDGFYMVMEKSDVFL